MGSYTFTVLASGSRGNVAILRTPLGSVLIDAGLNGRQLEARLREVGADWGEIRAVVLTHEHSDHIAGLPALLKRTGAEILANRATWDSLGLNGEGRWREWPTGSTVGVLSGVEMDSFPVPHDAAEPVGLVVRAAGTVVGVATDLGFATPVVVERLRGCGVLLLEANHDPAMLQADTKRPWAVKQRIANRHGHLSNGAAAELLARVAGPELRHVFLGHLSEDCNRPELAEQIIAETLVQLGRSAVQVHRTHPERVSATVGLG
ncbi:MAG: MBL fold metallo-hydrolase [Candidatus Methylacidiphilales bacterium]|nr:MBL fold metallo-hydrolase [Candidatus Methylacidiphilales bacterium]